MKIKIIAGSALLIVPVLLLAVIHRNVQSRPADFRDAVMDTLKASGGQEAAVPEARSFIPQVYTKEERISALGRLTLKMVSFKAKMERAELTLWTVSRIIENKEGGSLDNSLQQLSADLKKCTAAAREVNLAAEMAMTKIPKTPDTLATAKLLLVDIGAYTDNDETIITIRLERIMKSPAYKGRIQPAVQEYTRTVEALSKAGAKVVAFTGPLQAE